MGKKLEQKTYTAQMELKEDAEGEFRAVFATFNVVDKDDDLTVPGAFQDGGRVVIEPWNHGYDLPVGIGQIGSDQEKAWVDGRFFLDTAPGKEHYQTVKNLGAVVEWSYTFWIQDAAYEVRDEERIRILKTLDVAGVGPVTRGAGIGTRTERIKSARASSEDEGGGGDDTGGEGEGQGDSPDGEPVEPSGPPPAVVAMQIEIDLLEV